MAYFVLIYNKMQYHNKYLAEWAFIKLNIYIKFMFEDKITKAINPMKIMPHIIQLFF